MNDTDAREQSNQIAPKPLPREPGVLKMIAAQACNFLQEYDPIEKSLRTLQKDAKSQGNQNYCPENVDQQHTCWLNIRKWHFEAKAPVHLLTPYLSNIKVDFEAVGNKLRPLTPKTSERDMRSFISTDAPAVATVVLGFIAEVRNLENRITDPSRKNQNRIRRTYRNEARDRWIYYKLKSRNPRLTYREVLELFKQHKNVVSGRWNKLGTTNGLGKAADTYAERTEKDPLPPRKEQEH